MIKKLLSKWGYVKATEKPIKYPKEVLRKYGYKPYKAKLSDDVVKFAHTRGKHIFVIAINFKHKVWRHYRVTNDGVIQHVYRAWGSNAEITEAVLEILKGGYENAV